VHLSLERRVRRDVGHHGPLCRRRPRGTAQGRKRRTAPPSRADARGDETRDRRGRSGSAV